MTAKEYDDINPYFRKEIEKYNQKCIESNLSIHFHDSFFYMMGKYWNAKNLIKIIERSDFRDMFKMKVLLNKKNIGCKLEELHNAKQNLAKEKEKLFTFLDSTKEPYFFILTPYYRFGHGGTYKINGSYKKETMSGMQMQNLDIALDFANYVLNEK